MGSGLLFLYTLNRDDPSPERDTLAIFLLEKPEAPKFIVKVHTGLRHLCADMIIGKDSRWVVLGGMQGGSVKVYYEYVNGGRALREVASLPGVEQPTTSTILLGC